MKCWNWKLESLFHCHLWEQANQLILTGIVDFKTRQSYVKSWDENSVMCLDKWTAKLWGHLIHYQLEKDLSRC